MVNGNFINAWEYFCQIRDHSELNQAESLNILEMFLRSENSCVRGFSDRVFEKKFETD